MTDRSNAPRAGRRGFLAAAAALPLSGPLAAQERFPSRPMRMVVPFPPAGTSDIVGRLFAREIGQQLGQVVVVENRGGAGTVIGTDAVAKSPPDGYTMLLSSPGLAINATMRAAILPYDTRRDIDQIATLCELPLAIYVNAQSPLKSLADLLAAARKEPGRLTYGTAGAGATTHLSMGLFEQAAGAKLVHVPFKGSADSMTALLGGHIDLNCDTISLGAPHVQAGRMRVLATMSRARSPVMPDVPTVIESGVPGFVASAWFGIAVRGGAPADVVQTLNGACNAVLRKREVRETLDKMGMEIRGDSVADARKAFADEIVKWGKAVAATGVTPEKS